MEIVSRTPNATLRQRTVRVSVGSKTVGAGFLLSPDWVLTCAHLLSTDNFSLVGSDTNQIERTGPPVIFAEKIVMDAFDPWPDIALCPVSAVLEFDSIPIGIENPDPSDQLVGAGFPVVGESQQFATEVGSTIGFHGGAEEYLKSQSGWFREGFSGGPVYSSQLQAIVGFVVGTRNADQSEGGFFVSLRHVAERWEHWPESSALPSAGGPLGRPPRFRPRSEATWIAERLKEGGRRCAVLSSLPIPKSLEAQTDLALSYFQSDGAGDGPRVWLNVDGEGCLLDLYELAIRLGLEVDRGSPVALRTSVRRWFEQHDKDWLLVLHGANDIESIRELIPVEGLGRTVVTTQLQSWWNLGTVHDVALAVGTDGSPL